MAISSSQVRKVHFDTQDYGAQAITGLEPKDMPLLHQQQGKGSLEWENAGHVSRQPPVRAVSWAEGPTHLLPLLEIGTAPTHPRSQPNVGSTYLEKLGRANGTWCFQESIQVVVTGFLTHVLGLKPRGPFSPLTHPGSPSFGW